MKKFHPRLLLSVPYLLYKMRYVQTEINHRDRISLRNSYMARMLLPIFICLFGTFFIAVQFGSAPAAIFFCYVSGVACAYLLEDWAHTHL